MFFFKSFFFFSFQRQISSYSAIRVPSELWFCFSAWIHDWDGLTQQKCRWQKSFVTSFNLLLIETNEFSANFSDSTFFTYFSTLDSTWYKRTVDAMTPNANHKTSLTSGVACREWSRKAIRKTFNHFLQYYSEFRKSEFIFFSLDFEIRGLRSMPDHTTSATYSLRHRRKIRLDNHTGPNENAVFKNCQRELL